MNAMKKAISKVVERTDLTESEITEAMNQIMEGDATPAQIGALLTGLRMKSETVTEISEAASVMRQKAIRIPVSLKSDEVLVDTCGTGGDAAQTFNVSTAAAFVVAGAGIKVAKHGNRSVSSRCGSADVLEALGVDLSLSPEQAARAVETVGIGFLFAPALHPAMKYAIGPRREIGIRTIFNVLGPLTNPAGANVQIMGVYDPGLTRILAEVLGRLGSRKAWVVHGEGGFDELSLTGSTRVGQWDGQDVSEFTVTPEDAGLKRCRPEDLAGGDATENAEILRNILAGEKGPGRDMVILNAGAAIYLADMEATLRSGVVKAADSIDSGSAAARLEELIRFNK
ncbi:MAG TPA: anthranilate phosphoribosyltransferase [Thermodesulfobacteriaceae bacterium]|nr:anthranilate phosphoribosyltransferase [Thermodesulfobacteriaceae bacterium]